MQRAYVVADQPWAPAALTRAVSVAADSHLVVPHLRLGLAQQVEEMTASIASAREQHELQRIRERAERAREHAYGRYARRGTEAGAIRSHGMVAEMEP